MTSSSKKVFNLILLLFFNFFFRTFGRAGDDGTYFNMWESSFVLIVYLIMYFLILFPNLASTWRISLIFVFIDFIFELIICRLFIKFTAFSKSHNRSLILCNSSSSGLILPTYNSCNSFSISLDVPAPVSVFFAMTCFPRIIKKVFGSSVFE